MAEPAVCPGDTLGILGGGQLGRMIAMAAAALGLKSHVFCPDADSPAFEVADAHTMADYRDEAALTRFARSVAVVTYEFENVPAETAAVLSRHAPVRPNGDALRTSQDRLIEKQFIRSLGLETAPFVAVDDPGALARAVAQLGRPSILKTRRFGYDGKGQAMVREGSDLAVVFRSLGQKSILEGVVPFLREVSMIVARGVDGGFRAYELNENSHSAGILAATTLPAKVSAETERLAAEMARRIADALDYVGVLTVEMFVVPGEERRPGAARRQRDRAPRAQFGALDARRRGHVAVRAARARRLRLAARLDAALRRHPDAQPHRRRRRGVARHPGRARVEPAPLRQGAAAARAQDGPRDARDAGAAEGLTFDGRCRRRSDLPSRRSFCMQKLRLLQKSGSKRQLSRLPRCQV